MEVTMIDEPVVPSRTTRFAPLPSKFSLTHSPAVRPSCSKSRPTHEA